MNRTIEAIFENGVFRPAEPVQLPEGSRVSVTIQVDEQNAAKTPGRRAFEVFSRIAAMANEGPEDSFRERDHDNVIYKID